VRACACEHVWLLSTSSASLECASLVPSTLKSAWGVIYPHERSWVDGNFGYHLPLNSRVRARCLAHCNQESDTAGRKKRAGSGSLRDTQAQLQRKLKAPIFKDVHANSSEKPCTQDQGEGGCHPHEKRACDSNPPLYSCHHALTCGTHLYIPAPPISPPHHPFYSLLLRAPSIKALFETRMRRDGILDLKWMFVVADWSLLSSKVKMPVNFPVVKLPTSHESQQSQLG